MRKSKIGKVTKIIGIMIGILLFIFLSLTIFHRISLSRERNQLEPIGQLVEVNGSLMHVYIEGQSEDAPMLVFLSGFGTTAPVYDFQPIYELLSMDFQIAVVERFGYGYSDIVDNPRDITTVVEETRMALTLAGATGPYILLPHSMSGLEVLHWAQLYPEEVLGIIGIDMAVPSFYFHIGESGTGFLRLQSLFTSIMGGHRFFLPASASSLDLSEIGLTETAYEQATLLRHRNLLNRTTIAESGAVYQNAHTVAQLGIPDIPILLLVSNQQEEPWTRALSDFATDTGTQIEFLDGSHYLHHDVAEYIDLLSRSFINSILGIDF